MTDLEFGIFLVCAAIVMFGIFIRARKMKSDHRKSTIETGPTIKANRERDAFLKKWRDSKEASYLEHLGHPRHGRLKFDPENYAVISIKSKND